MRSTLFFAFILISAPFAFSPIVAAQDGLMDQIGDAANSVIESKETRYKREQKEADEKLKKEEELKWQEEQIRKNQKVIIQKRSELNRSHGQQNAGPRVEIFVASRCEECSRLESLLRDSGIVFQRYSLETDKAAEADYLESIGRGKIPVLRIGHTIIRGYHPQEIRTLLLCKGVSKGTAKQAPAPIKDSWVAGAPLPEAELPNNKEQPAYQGIPAEEETSPY